MTTNDSNVVNLLKQKINKGEFKSVSEVTYYIDKLPISLEEKSEIFESIRKELEVKFLNKNVNNNNNKNAVFNTDSNTVPVIDSNDKDAAVSTVNNKKPITLQNNKEMKLVRSKFDNNNHGLTYYKFFVILMIEAIIVLGVITYLTIK